MGKFGALESSDTPLVIELIDPVTGSVIKDSEGKAAYIKAYAEDGVKGREFDKLERAAHLEQARKGIVSSETDRVELNIKKCAYLTTEWHLVDPDTRQPLDVPCNAENAREFYSLPASNWFAQVWLKVVNNANFMKRSAKTSTSMQSGTSETAAN